MKITITREDGDPPMETIQYERVGVLSLCGISYDLPQGIPFGRNWVGDDWPGLCGMLEAQKLRVERHGLHEL